MDKEANNKGKQTDLEHLTEEQKKHLLQAMEIVEQKIFVNITKRFRNYLIVAVSLLTLFGAISWVGLKNTIKDATVASLREDSTLRLSIREDAQKKITEVEKVMERLREVEAQAKRDKADGNVILEESLKDLNKLIDDLREQVQQKK